MDHIRIPSNFNDVTLQQVKRMQGKKPWILSFCESVLSSGPLRINIVEYLLYRNRMVNIIHVGLCKDT